jgi:hypothetical protein
MINKLQFLRSLSAGTSPVGLSVGEIAFNLSDKKLFVGNGTDTITRLDGTTESVDLGTGYFESDLTALSANAYTDQKIADLVDSAPALLNTLNELAAAIGNDENFIVNVATSIATVQTNLYTETARAEAAEATLSGHISSEATRAQAAEGVISSDLANEISRAQAAEGQLGVDLANEVIRAQATEAALQGDINDEAARALAAEAAIAADLVTETARALAAEGILQNNIDAEASASLSANVTLQNNINAEAATRAANDITLQNNIDSVSSVGQAAIAAEAARAQSVENMLNSRLSDIENGVDLGTFGGGGQAQAF